MVSFLCILSTVIVTHFPTPSGSRVVDIKAEPDEGWMANTEAPWELHIEKESNVKVETQEFKLDLPGFVLETKGKEKEAGERFRYRTKRYSK